MISRLALIVPLLAVLFGPRAARAAATNNPVEATLRGRRLVHELLERRPETNYTQTGILRIRPPKGRSIEYYLRCDVVVTPTNWQNIYQAIRTNADGSVGGGYLAVTHAGDGPGEYTWSDSPSAAADHQEHWSGTQWIHPFSGSDFWAFDLGLEFLHWPEQKILRHEFRDTLGCSVLESTNPEPAANGYSRVLSWIDNDSGGLVHAEAYDAKGKLLKEYDTKKIQKMANGQVQLQEMRIDNDQTDSRTRIDFDVKPD